MTRSLPVILCLGLCLPFFSTESGAQPTVPPPSPVAPPGVAVANVSPVPLGLSPYPGSLPADAGFVHGRAPLVPVGSALIQQSQVQQPQAGQVPPGGEPGGPGNPLQSRTYSLKTIRPDDAETQLRALLSTELASQTVMLADMSRNELFVQGPPTALLTIDVLLPAIDGSGEKVTVGLLPPRDTPVLPPQVMPIPVVPTQRPYAATAPDPVHRPWPPSVPGPVQPLAVNPMSTLLTRPSVREVVRGEPVPHAPTVSPVVAQPALAPTDVPEVLEPSSPAVYRVRSERAGILERQLREAFGARMDVCIAVGKEIGTGANRICILAPESIQAAIRRTLEQGGDLLPDVETREKEGTLVRIPSTARNGATESRDAHAPAPQAVPQSHAGPVPHAPVHLTSEQIERTLHGIFGKRLKMRDSGQGGYEIDHPREPGRNITIALGPPNAQGTREIGIYGDADMVVHMLTLVKSIDRPTPSRGRARRFIAVQHADPEAIRGIFEAELARSNPAPDSPVGSPRIGHTGNNRNNRPIRQVAFTMQDGGTMGTDPGGGLAEADAGPGMSGASSGMEVVPDFRYQVIPELDVIVIDATGAEVARFEDMIRRIEELSRTSEPKIEIYYLKHLNGVSLRWAVQQVLAPVFRTKQGSVDIMPLVNPNAILLIGWGKAFDTMKDLFETLDQPVAADQHSMKVIRLQHAAAARIVPTLRQAFPPVAFAGAGFAPRINVIIADQRTNAIIVQAGPNDLKEVERIIRELDVTEAGPSVEVRTFKLKNTLANDLAQVLHDAITPGIQGTPDAKLPTLEMLVADEHGRRMIRSGIMSDVRISHDVRNNTIIITGPSNCMELIAHLIEMLDVPNATAVIKVFRILYGDASSMVATLQALLPTQLAGQVGPMLPGAREEDTLVPVRFAIDKRTNSIIAAGAVGDLDIVDGLLLSLDREEEQARKVSVYQLKSSQAADIALAVNEYLAAKRLIQNAIPGTVSAYEQLESEVVVIPEHIQNSLIVSATPRYYDEIIRVIEELDRQPAQVVIQVLIAEVTLGNTKELGAEFGIQDSLLFDRSTFNAVENNTTRTTTINADGTKTIVETTPANAPGSPGFAWGNPINSLGNGINPASLAGAGTIGSQLLTNFATGRTNAGAGFGGIVFSASSDAVSIMLRALQETRRLDILSRPQIMALDNQSAFIHVGQDVPRVGGTESNNISTRSDVREEKIGLLLMVKPRISADNRVVMDVTAVKSSLDNTDEGVTVGSEDGVPIRSQKINVMQTMTMVSAADKETVILGGMISKEKQCINRKVPWLGDVPLLGKLFQYNYNQTRRSELLVVLTPRIVRDRDDAERIKQVEAARMSWCLSEVEALHGNTALYDAGSEIPVTGDTTILYPGTVVEEDILPLEQHPLLHDPGRPGNPRVRQPAPPLAPLPQESPQPQPPQQSVPRQKTFPTPTLPR